MKEIKAYIRVDKLEEILWALKDLGVRDLTVIRVDAVGAMADPAVDHMRFLRRFSEAYSQFANLEIVCRDQEAGRVVETIRERGRTASKDQERRTI